jgi:hypothetical protein
MRFDDFRTRFQRLYDFVNCLHKASKRPHRGHGLDHDVTVGMLAARIAPGPQTAELGFCAGLLHSVDRIVEEDEVERMVLAGAELVSQFFTEQERGLICAAVMRHEAPRDDDSLVQQVLMDADRLANVMLSGALRAAQWLQDRPVVEFELSGERNPATTWGAPCSALDGVKVVYQMLHPMRTPKGKEIAERYVAQLSAFVAGVEEQYRELGLVGITL